MNLFFYYFFILNGLAFLLMGYDKHLAKAQKQRIPEQTLLSFVLFGGTLGSSFGMLIFRHKTSKRAYLLKYWGIVFIQVLLVFWWFYPNDLNEVLIHKILKSWN